MAAGSLSTLASCANYNGASQRLRLNAGSGAFSKEAPQDKTRPATPADTLEIPQDCEPDSVPSGRPLTGVI